MRTKFLALLHILSRPAVAIGGSLAIAAVVVGGTWYLTSVSPSGAYTAATVSSINEEVDASGPVQGAETTDLSFQISGAVAAVPATVGQHVYAGQVLVALSGGSQAASLAIAQAGLDAAQANLAAVEAGTRPEQIAIDQSAVAQDQSAIADSIRTAYVASDSAVHTSADQLFTNPRTGSAALTISVPDSALANRVTTERIALEQVLTDWGAAVAAPGFGTGDSATIAAATTQDLVQVNAFLDDLAAALTKVQPTPAMPAATLASYQAAIASARSGIAGSLSALTGAKSALVSAQGALTLAQAGATPQAIAAVEAQVNAAAAQVAAARVNSNETVIVAPVSGTVTRQDAHLGATVAPGVPLVSMIGDGAFEAKVPVSESAIGKIKVGQVASVTFDAYPGSTFAAAVTAVDPAATLTNGVASYQITATFSKNDPRIQSGLTAHLSIITATVADAIVVPASAVINNGGTQFVYVHSGKSDIQTPVTTGVENAGGMVQILSGLSAGDKVLTFGNSH